MSVRLSNVGSRTYRACSWVALRRFTSGAHVKGDAEHIYFNTCAIGTQAGCEPSPESDAVSRCSDERPVIIFIGAIYGGPELMAGGCITNATSWQCDPLGCGRGRRSETIIACLVALVVFLGWPRNRRDVIVWRCAFASAASGLYLMTIAIE